MATSIASGAVSRRAPPTAWTIRPQFGSPPCSAALTSGELPTARAAASTPPGLPPRTTTRPMRLEPSPSRTISSASWRSTASSACPKTSSSSDSGATRTPLAPDAIRITVSFVESWPSTVMRSNERFTQTPSSRSAVSGASAASVCTKHSIVAKFGCIIPAPLAWALMRTAPDGSCTSSEQRFSNASVVMIASLNAASPSALIPREHSSSPLSTFSPGSGTPITPVEQTATRSSVVAATIAAPPCIFAASSRPGRPVAALALPELTATARSRRAACAPW